MSIAFQSNTENAIGQSRFTRGMPCISIYDAQKVGLFAGDRRFEVDSDSCSSSSSIGRDSDLSEGLSDGEESGETEVVSSSKESFVCLDELEEVLPIKKGISKFYRGKSKSFTSLADASSVSSVKEFAKPEDPYTRKRKNLFAHANFWEKSDNYSVTKNGGGILKKPTNCIKSRLVPEVATNNPSEESSSISSSPSCCLPPLHPQGNRLPSNGSSSPPAQRNSPWRSFSLSDLQSVAAATPNITGSSNTAETANE